MSAGAPTAGHDSISPWLVLGLASFVDEEVHDKVPEGHDKAARQIARLGEQLGIKPEIVFV